MIPSTMETQSDVLSIITDIKNRRAEVSAFDWLAPL